MDVKTIFNKYKGLVVVVSLVIVIMGIYNIFFTNPDIVFTRQTFVNLVQARQSVQNSIDWERFQAMGVDVAQELAKCKTEQERSDFCRLLIQGVATGFKNIGGKLSAFTNWRVYAKDNAQTTVAVDNVTHNKTLLLTITNQPPRKLISMQWAGNK